MWLFPASAGLGGTSLAKFEPREAHHVKAGFI